MDSRFKSTLTDWHSQLAESIVGTESLEKYFSRRKSSQVASVENSKIELRQNRANTDRVNIDTESISSVIRRYPMRITPYYLSLIERQGDPIWKQAIPDEMELHDERNTGDPLHEERQSPTPSIIHRYPDRVIFLVSNRCAVYCRHCMRKRKVGLEISDSKKNGDYSADCERLSGAEMHTGRRDGINAISDASSRQTPLQQQIFNTGLPEYLAKGVNYIRGKKEIRDVILSGGDPLLLETEMIDRILRAVREIEHVETMRIHTRAICTIPSRVTENLAAVLEKYHPLYINTHFNHPAEITDEAAAACSRLARAGIPLGCQTVLLKGVNDSPEIMEELFRKLIRIRVKPYYLHHPDAVEGTSHFRVPLETGLGIMRAIRGNLTGIAIPQYMIDIPGGFGKIPVLPNYIKSLENSRAVVENYQGITCEYPL